MRSSINSSLWFHFNPDLLPYFIRTSQATSWDISELLHPPSLQQNTRLSNMPHISSSLSETLHPATTLSKLSTPFTKNVSTKTKQNGHSLLPVTNPWLTLNKQNFILLPLPLHLPLVSMMFQDPRTVGASLLLLLTSCLTTVSVRYPTNSWYLWPDLFYRDQATAWTHSERTPNLPPYCWGRIVRYCRFQYYYRRIISWNSVRGSSQWRSKLFSQWFSQSKSLKLDIYIPTWETIGRATIRRTYHSSRSWTNRMSQWRSTFFSQWCSHSISFKLAI